jgi:hypothetical protein
MRSRFGRLVSGAALVAALGLAGCSSGDDSSGTFVGMWMWSPGMRMITCPGIAPLSEPLMGSMVVSRGIDAPLVTSVNNGTCTLRLDPSGNSAILRMGQTCPPTTGSFTDGTQYTETDTFNTGNFAVNGRVATISLSASASIVFGQSIVCSYSITGTLQKTSQ